MRKLFTHPDGTLRTGRAAVLVFGALLAFMALIYQWSSPVDEALVEIRHVFEPQQKNESAPIAKAEVEPPAREAAVRKRIEREKASPPEKAAREPDAGSSFPKQEEDAAPEGAGTEKPKTNPAHKPNAELAQKAQQDPGSRAPEGGEAYTPAPGSVPPDEAPAENPAPTEVQKASHKDEETGAEGREASSRFQTAEMAELLGTGKPGENPRAGSDAWESLRNAVSGEKERKPKDSVSLTASFDDEKRGPGEDAAADQTNSPPPGKGAQEDARADGESALPAPQKSAQPVSVCAEERSVTVDPKQYVTLYRAWGSVGAGDSPEENIPLRVESLRKTYRLFQMKPVLVLDGRPHLDLRDGTRIARGALADFSGTVFVVENPWSKWAEALEEFGVSPDARIEIRYYMYGMVRDAIYARVAQGFRWCRERGLIGADIAPGQVDVLGRAYTIRRQGGGLFGVFLPVSLDTPNGRRVPIDPACFHGQPDVELLRTAGLV